MDCLAANSELTAVHVAVVVGGVGWGDKSSRGRWLRLRSYWKGGRAIASTLERPNSKLQAGARGVNGQRLAQDPSVDVMT